MPNAPVEHIEESLKLSAEDEVDLWEVHLRVVNSVVRFTNRQSRTWQGNLYESLPCQLTGEGRSADDQANRPTLVIVNPAKVFAPFAAAGYLDLATVIRKRVMGSHYLNDVDIYQQRVWLCGRPSAVTGQSLQLELRSPLDSPLFKVPTRIFAPPDYPFVVL